MLRTTVIAVLAPLALSLGLYGLHENDELQSQRAALQTAADAASLGGAVVIWQGGSPAQAIAAATTDARLNDVDGSTRIRVSSPPENGAHVGDASYVEVTIERDAQSPLVPLIRVSSVAGATAQGPGR